MKIQSNYTVLYITKAYTNTGALTWHIEMILIEEKAAKMGKAQTSCKLGRCIDWHREQRGEAKPCPAGGNTDTKHHPGHCQVPKCCVIWWWQIIKGGNFKLEWLTLCYLHDKPATQARGFGSGNPLRASNKQPVSLSGVCIFLLWKDVLLAFTEHPANEFWRAS